MEAFFVGLALSFTGALAKLSYDHPVFARKLILALLGLCFLIHLGICCYNKGWADASLSKVKLDVDIYSQKIYIADCILIALFIFCLIFKKTNS
jgi:hypothetical protein